MRLASWLALSAKTRLCEERSDETILFIANIRVQIRRYLLSQGLIEVGDQIVDCLDAYGQSNQLVADA